MFSCSKRFVVSQTVGVCALRVCVCVGLVHQKRYKRLSTDTRATAPMETAIAQQLTPSILDPTKWGCSRLTWRRVVRPAARHCIHDTPPLPSLIAAERPWPNALQRESGVATEQQHGPGAGRKTELSTISLLERRNTRFLLAVRVAGEWSGKLGWQVRSSVFCDNSAAGGGEQQHNKPCLVHPANLQSWSKEAAWCYMEWECFHARFGAVSRTCATCRAGSSGGVHTAEDFAAVIPPPWPTNRGSWQWMSSSSYERDVELYSFLSAFLQHQRAEQTHESPKDELDSPVRNRAWMLRRWRYWWM